MIQLALSGCESADVFYSFNFEGSWRETSRKDQWNRRWLSKRMIFVDDEKICFDVLLYYWQSCSFAPLAFVLFLHPVIIVRLSEINRKTASTCPECECWEREKKHRKRKHNCDDWFLSWEGMHPCAVLSLSLYLGNAAKQSIDQLENEGVRRTTLCQSLHPQRSALSWSFIDIYRHAASRRS